MQHNSMAVRVAAEADLTQVLRVQREAFGRVAAELDIDPTFLPPLRETIDDLRALVSSGTVFFVATADDTIVGSVRGTPEADRISIGRLVVASGWLRRGVASELMSHLESHFAAAERFVLFTGADAAAPLALYAKLGYETTHSQSENGVELVWLSKTVRPERDLLYPDAHV